MENYYVLHSVVENEDYYAEKVSVSVEKIFDLSLKGESLKNENLAIKLKRSRGIVRNVIGNIYSLPIISELIGKILVDNCPDEIELIEIIVDKSTNLKYYLLNILNNIDAIDFQKSNYKEIIPDTKILKEINKLVLDNSKIGKRQIFRLKDFEFIIVISEKLKNSLKQLDISEYKFILIEDFQYKAGGVNIY